MRGKGGERERERGRGRGRGKEKREGEGVVFKGADARFKRRDTERERK